MKKLIAVSLLLAGLIACTPRQQDINTTSSTSYLSRLNTTHTISLDSIRYFIRTGLVQTENQTVWDSVITTYYTGQDRLLWLNSNGRRQVDSLLYWLDNAHRHGLDAEIFSKTRIEKEIKHLEQLAFDEGKSINHSLAVLEYTLTRAYMRYACGMSYGFISPHRLLNNMEVDDDIKYANVLVNGKRKMKTLYQIPLKSCSREYAEQVFADLQAAKSAEVLRRVQPASTFYTLMQQEMDRFRPLADATFEPIPDMGDALVKEGESHPAIPLIARRLLITGEYKPETADTVNTVLTAELLAAVNKFRVSNRLPEDNSIGSFTVRFLNNPMSYYLDRIRVNLERERWQYAMDKGKKYVFVNTAAFMLKAVNEVADSIVEMRICCGTARNKTPLLASKIFYIELNPYWNVPQNIIKKEIIPAYRRDTAYFAKHRMKVYDSAGNQVNLHDVKWSNYARGVPFTVKQDNREGNSLGRIIFRFPNTFAVYLHDTPVRSAFLRTNRAVSHGCVRLERALDFAFFLLDKPDPVLEDRIRVAMSLRAQSDEGKRVTQKQGYKDLEFYNLKEHIPLFLDYQTMYLSADGVLTYCEDTYKYDKALLDATRVDE
ncbi:L,D-transpeptidase family protein [Bacteroides sp. 51]|uniref:L,D-transpeptidase family protein n=1 Tax=Bacteroides sp. 51 TaxID=2302938 RepID=UPI0013D7EE62|nr:L,D-transpeptidase family protein [Bacteroides sp. 51]NDV82372.1 L,D-transpeptidase [Bacteroides sp. 51]